MGSSVPGQSKRSCSALRPGRRTFSPWLTMRRTHALVAVAAHPQEAGALRRADPLVQIARVVVRQQAVEVQRAPRRARARHRRAPRCRAAPSARTMPRDGQDERRRAGHVIDHREARALGDRAHDRVEDLGVAREREGDLRDDHLRAAAPRGFEQHVAAGVVIVARGEQLVARLQVERAHHGVHAGRRVLHEDQVVALAAEETPPAPRARRRAAARTRAGGSAPAALRAGRATAPALRAPPADTRRTSRD